jgi:hypothetical protein
MVALETILHRRALASQGCISAPIAKSGKLLVGKWCVGCVVYDSQGAVSRQSAVGVEWHTNRAPDMAAPRRYATIDQSQHIEISH